MVTMNEFRQLRLSIYTFIWFINGFRFNIYFTFVIIRFGNIVRETCIFNFLIIKIDPQVLICRDNNHENQVSRSSWISIHDFKRIKYKLTLNTIPFTIKFSILSNYKLIRLKMNLNSSFTKQRLKWASNRPLEHEAHL